MTEKLGPTNEGYDPYEMSGRLLENPFGTTETVVLKQIWWDYYDWLGEQGCKTTALVRHCYNRKPHMPIGDALTWLLWDIAWHRQENRIRQPSWLEAAPPPGDYEQF